MVESSQKTWESEERYDPVSQEAFWPLDYLIKDLKVDPTKIEYEKLIDFKRVKWPEEDVINFKHLNKYKVKNYFYPAQNPKARIFFYHGYGDYAERYAYFFKKLASQGYETFALDVCGFGHSEGWARGVIYSGEDTLLLWKSFIIKVEEKFEQRPTFFVGHSMGSLFSFAQTLDHKFESLVGIIALTPYFGLCEPFKTQSWRARWIAKPIAFFYPSCQLAQLGTNVEEPFKQHFIRDTNCEFSVKAHSIATIGGIVEQYSEKGSLINIPTKVYIGEKDDFVCPIAAKKFYEEIDCEKKEIKIFPTSHTILADGEHIDELALDMLVFMDSVL